MSQINQSELPILVIELHLLMPFGEIVLQKELCLSGKSFICRKMLPITAFMIMDFRMAAILHDFFQFQKILDCNDHFFSFSYIVSGASCGFYFIYKARPSVQCGIFASKKFLHYPVGKLKCIAFAFKLVGITVSLAC